MKHQASLDEEGAFLFIDMNFQAGIAVAIFFFIESPLLGKKHLAKIEFAGFSLQLNLNRAEVGVVQGGFNLGL